MLSELMRRCAKKHSKQQLVERLSKLTDREFLVINHGLEPDENLAMSCHLSRMGIVDTLLEQGQYIAFKHSSKRQRFIAALNNVEPASRA